MNLKIADIPICWPDVHKDFVTGFESESEPVLNPEFTLSITPGFQQCHGIEFLEGAGPHFLRRASDSSQEVLFANEDWTQATIYCDRYEDENYSLPLAALCARFAYFQALLLHGSLVDLSGEGIVFTGYSGIGKTTQAKLWEQYLKAEIINGDKVVLRVMEDQVFGYGIPWKGSSPYCLNRKVPVKAIVALQQAKGNSIEKLDSMACMEHFMPHIFLPHWDSTCMAKALDAFDTILANTPVYLLKCRPDEDAVLLTKEMIYG